jgi:iron complex transport system ATP-binding protein
MITAGQQQAAQHIPVHGYDDHIKPAAGSRQQAAQRTLAQHTPAHICTWIRWLQMFNRANPNNQNCVCSVPVSVHDLAVGYGSRAVLKGASFEIRAGEVLAIIGPNGAGKSTLLKTLAAQLPILGGTVLLMNTDIRELRPEDIARRLSLFLTDRPSSEWMTCRELVSAGRYPYTGRLGLLSEADWAIVDAAMERMDAEELSGLPFNSISDGQKQRVLLARALCQEPQVLLLDEPASFLDIRYQLELASTLKRLAHEDGLAIAVTLHDLSLIRRMADRVVCLKDGRVDRIGAADEILTNSYMERLFDLPSGSL